MSDLISKAEVLSLLESMMETYWDRKQILSVVRSNIEKLPSAEPKKGKWIKENVVLTSNPPQYVWHCSECGNPERGFSAHILTNHCPACGAKMEGETNE